MNLILLDAVMAVLFWLCASIGVLLIFSELQWKSFVESLDREMIFYSIE